MVGECLIGNSNTASVTSCIRAGYDQNMTEYMLFHVLTFKDIIKITSTDGTKNVQTQKKLILKDNQQEGTAAKSGNEDQTKFGAIIQAADPKTNQRQEAITESTSCRQSGFSTLSRHQKRQSSDCSNKEFSNNDRVRETKYRLGLSDCSD